MITTKTYKEIKTDDKYDNITTKTDKNKIREKTTKEDDIRLILN